MIGCRCIVKPGAVGFASWLSLTPAPRMSPALLLLPTAKWFMRCKVEDGAMVIDINLDDGLLDGMAAMQKFCKIAVTEPDVSKVRNTLQRRRIMYPSPPSREYFPAVSAVDSRVPWLLCPSMSKP